MSDHEQAVFTICTTCRLNAKHHDDRLRAGARLFQKLSEVAIADGKQKVIIERYACLWACSMGCVAHIAAAGKPGYLLGQLDPQSDDIADVLEFVRLYDNSDDGVVPFEFWPRAVHNHFIARTPPKL